MSSIEVYRVDERIVRGGRFLAFQASARGGVVKVRVVRDRVLLGGKAITVARGQLPVEGDGVGGPYACRVV